MTDNNTKYGRVAVLMGGVSSEREIAERLLGFVRNGRLDEFV